jgi:hypothetical protein
MENERLDLLKMLAERLERLNVDSKWARRASGTRGAILKVLAADENGGLQTSDDLDVLIQKSLEILTKAAREIPDLEELRKRYFHLEG